MQEYKILSVDINVESLVTNLVVAKIDFLTKITTDQIPIKLKLSSLEQDPYEYLINLISTIDLSSITGDKNYYYNNSSFLLTEFPSKPAVYYTWDWNSYSWIDARTEKQKYADAAAASLPKRLQLLLDSDWTQLPNGPLTTAQQQAWATYRQDLRDITAQAGYPFEITWPTPPT